jgi:hypothetical protein
MDVFKTYCFILWGKEFLCDSFFTQNKMSLSYKYAHLQLTEEQWRREARRLSREAELAAKVSTDQKEQQKFKEYAKDLKECALCQDYIVGFMAAKEVSWQRPPKFSEGYACVIQ